jgi:hypothetical protein
LVRGEVRFDEAARERLRYTAEDRACKPTTMRDYRNTVERRLLPFFGGMRLDAITPQMIETWRASLTSGARTKNKQLTILNGIMRRACGSMGCRRTRSAASSACASPRIPSFRCSSPRRPGRSFAPPATSRTPRSPDRGVHGAAHGRAARCAGATSTSPARSSASTAATATAT